MWNCGCNRIVFFFFGNMDFTGGMRVCVCVCFSANGFLVGSFILFLSFDVGHFRNAHEQIKIYGILYVWTAMTYNIIIIIVIILQNDSILALACAVWILAGSDKSGQATLWLSCFIRTSLNACIVVTLESLNQEVFFCKTFWSTFL